MNPPSCRSCGALSSDPEFCSECGTVLSAPVNTPNPPGGPDPAQCPACGEARPGPHARYCDTCRYDFLTRQAFVPISTAPPPPPTALPPAPAIPAGSWDLRCVVDLSLRAPDDPLPPDQHDRLFPLDLASHLIGRRSDGGDNRPEISIPDPGISRRHARIQRDGLGGLSLLDLGSTNGTKLNGQALAAHVPTPLKPGDVVTLGCWTRLTLETR